jgi:uncharacterized protein
MANQHGEFIWYELMTGDPDAAQAFYGEVVGWKIGEQSSDDDYRHIAAGDDFIGGLLPLTDEMREHGARPVWLGYIAVNDVDTTVSELEELGGRVLMPARDLPDVGRIAMVADPQGVPFYVMRGSVEGETSTAFKPMAEGHCGWNELATTDQAGALDFYGRLFGWTSHEAMSMGEIGDYRFLDHHGVRLGAVSPYLEESASPIWSYYFRVADIDLASAKTAERGGKVLHGPMEVPGGDHIIVGLDPEGAMFALVGPTKS